MAVSQGAGPAVALMALIFSLVLLATGLAFAIVSYKATEATGSGIASTDSRVLGVDPATGKFYETGFTVGDYAAFTAPATTKRASVLSSGAAVLNVTMEVVRQGKRRSWMLWTEGGGALVTDANKTITIDFNGTGVLLESDMALLVPKKQNFEIVDCGYLLVEPVTLHACAVFVYANGTLVLTPVRIHDTLGAVPFYNTLGFESYQLGKTIKVSANFNWIV